MKVILSQNLPDFGDVYNDVLFFDLDKTEADNLIEIARKQGFFITFKDEEE